jgi:hypothetical protein
MLYFPWIFKASQLWGHMIRLLEMKHFLVPLPFFDWCSMPNETKKKKIKKKRSLIMPIVAAWDSE